VVPEVDALHAEFRWRTIAERADGVIMDVLVWDSVEPGEASAARLMEEQRDSVVHSLINMRTVSWTVSPVLHSF
jgi:hypothetical protein